MGPVQIMTGDGHTPGQQKVTPITSHFKEMFREHFEKLKAAVAEDVLLTFPDYSKGASKMELFVDASGSGCGIL